MVVPEDRAWQSRLGKLPLNAGHLHPALETPGAGISANPFSCFDAQQEPRKDILGSLVHPEKWEIRAGWWASPSISAQEQVLLGIRSALLCL